MQSRNETSRRVFNSWMYPAIARARIALVTALAAAALTACGNAAEGFGPTRATALRNADEFLGVYTSRYVNVTRPPRLAYLRANLGRGALIPSRVFADTGIWTAQFGDTARLVAYSASFTGGRYAFSLRNPPERVLRPADSHHTTRLRRLSRDEYEWNTAADFHVGSMPPNALPTVVAHALRAAESLGADGVRADYRANYPRTTAALGRLYSLDSIRVVRDSEGASTIWLTVTATPERLRATHPSLADYLNKYLDGTNARITILDRRGARWFELDLRDRRVQLRMRSRDGQFAPLEGPVRPLPASLVLRTDFTTRILLFNVGWRSLVSDMTVVRGEHDQAWQFRATREPEWELPPLTSRFIRTPLRRPFSGPGANFRIGFRALPGGGTSLYRRGLLQVQESPILRFLGRLSGQAMGDFYGRSEADEDSFNRDVFAALRADVREALAD